MRSEWMTKLRGYVKIEVYGGNQELFLHLLLDNHLEIWDIARTDEHSMNMHILLRDYFRLRPILKQTGCRVRTKQRVGFPFLLDKLEKRKFLLGGFVGFIIAVYFLSTFVWQVQVEVEGMGQITKQQVLDAARKQGVYSFQWKPKLDDPDQLSRAMMQELPGASWIGVDIQGTKVHIKVVESRLLEPRPLLSPRHLVSTSDAVITKMIVEKGRPMVKVNQRVKRGDILVSGILGDEENQQIVVAQGEVRGLVWYEYRIEAPLSQTYKTYTGESKERKYIVFGDWALKVWGYGNPGFKHSESDVMLKKLQWRKWSLPIGWMSEKVMEVRPQQRIMEVEEAKSLSLQQAKTELLSNIGDHAIIREQNILHEKTESGKVYMKVLFEVEQNIHTELPIIQGE